MVNKLRHFVDKMILIKRHQAASLDQKCTNILPQKDGERQRKGNTPIIQAKTPPLRPPDPVKQQTVNAHALQGRNQTLYSYNQSILFFYPRKAHLGSKGQTEAGLDWRSEIWGPVQENNVGSAGNGQGRL